jgi:hypothetical protein
MVYVRKGAKGPLVPPYSGPYKVLRKGPKVFHIEVGGVEQLVTVDRLKPHTGGAAADPPATQAARPRGAAHRPPQRPRQLQETSHQGSQQLHVQDQQENVAGPAS